MKYILEFPNGCPTTVSRPEALCVLKRVMLQDEKARIAEEAESALRACEEVVTVGEEKIASVGTGEVVTTEKKEEATVTVWKNLGMAESPKAAVKVKVVLRPIAGETKRRRQ